MNRYTMFFTGGGCSYDCQTTAKTMQEAIDFARNGLTQKYNLHLQGGTYLLLKFIYAEPKKPKFTPCRLGKKK